MAGSYPDFPGRRMAWDDDHSVAFYGEEAGTGVLTEWSSGQKTLLNNENSDQVNFGLTQPQRYYWTIFPELREIDGFWASNYGSGTPPRGDLENMYTSPDTTNGRDGVWTSRITDCDDRAVPNTVWRNNIDSLAVPTIRGIRLWQRNSYGAGGGSDQRIAAIHIYGEISPGETPNRLLFMDEATGLEFGAAGAPEVMDWGDRPRGSAQDWEFRLKNNSTVAGDNLTATTVQLTAEALYLGSDAWYTYSDDGTSFSATLPITSIAPEASTTKLYMRQTIPAVIASLWTHAARSEVTVATWA